MTLDALGSSVTAEDLHVFLSRANEDEVLHFFNSFWRNYSNDDEQFVQCAIMILHHVGLKSFHFLHFESNNSAAIRIFKFPELLCLMQEYEIYTNFPFDAIKAGVCDDFMFKMYYSTKDFFCSPFAIILLLKYSNYLTSKPKGSSLSLKCLCTIAILLVSYVHVIRGFS